MKQFLKKADSLMIGLQEITIGIVILSATAVVMLNIIMRYFFANSLMWAEEFVRYSIIWTVFLSSSLCIRNNMHIKIDTLQIALPFKAEKILVCFIYAISIVGFAVFAWVSWNLTQRMMFFDVRSQTMPWLSMWMVNLSLPVFGVLATKDSIQLLVLNLIRKGEIVRTVGGGLSS